MGKPAGRLRLIATIFLITTLLSSAHTQFSRPWWRSEWPPNWFEDISYIWFEGYHIKHGENPYSRIAGKDLRFNEKFATYLPLFYLATAATEYPLPWYSDWMIAWRIASFLCYAAIGAILFEMLFNRGMILAALFALLFWSFNRWSVIVLDIAHTDFLAILFLLLSILYLDTHRRTALLCLGVSLGIKHIAVVLLPLYAIWIWVESSPANRTRNLLEAAGWTLAVPLAVSLPFLVVDPVSFVRTFLFSATRVGDGHFGAPSIDQYVSVVGFPGKVLMTFIFILIFAGAAARQIPRFVSVFLVLLVFSDFNSVGFRQYMVWPIPFLLLSPLELLRRPGSAARLEGDWLASGTAL